MKMRKLNNDKYELQEKNKELVDIQMKLKGEISVLKMANNQMARDVETFKDLAEHNQGEEVNSFQRRLHEKEFDCNMLN